MPTRHIFLYICGVIIFTMSGPLLRTSAEPCHQIRKLQQVCDTQQRTPLAEHNLRIGRLEVRPLPRHRANAFIVDTQQESCPVPVVPLAYTDELSSGERMERVRHAHKTWRCSERARI